MTQYCISCDVHCSRGRSTVEMALRMQVISPCDFWVVHNIPYSIVDASHKSMWPLGCAQYPLWHCGCESLVHVTAGLCTISLMALCMRVISPCDCWVVHSILTPLGRSRGGLCVWSEVAKGAVLLFLSAIQEVLCSGTYNNQSAVRVSAIQFQNNRCRCWSCGSI
jgi:hypothetical protein